MAITRYIHGCNVINYSKFITKLERLLVFRPWSACKNYRLNTDIIRLHHDPIFIHRSIFCHFNDEICQIPKNKGFKTIVNLWSRCMWR